tara:strand:- start:7075 stop:9855 length:2781 start_codon:yes stop_codon:yes gene_type:complete
MTLSNLLIDVKRSRRDFTKKPQAKATPEQPATPAREPTPTGGQLLDMHRFIPGTEGQVIDSIQNFMSEQGAWPGIENRALKKHIEGAARTAKDLLEQKEQAYKDLDKIGAETAQLQKQKDFQDAKANRLADPWANFFYYDVEANNALLEATLRFNEYGSKNVGRLAKNDNDSEIAVDLSKKSSEILAKYNYIPKAWHEGLLEPALAKQQSEIKKQVIERRFENTDATFIKSGTSLIHGAIRNGIRINKLGNGAYQAEQAEIIAKGVADAQALLYKHFGDEKVANSYILDAFKNLYIDSDKEGEEGYLENDLGELLTGDQLKRALSGIRVNGIPLLELRDKDNNPLSLIIDKQSAAAWSRQDKKNNIAVYDIQDKTKQFKIDTKLDATKRIAEAVAANDGQPLNSKQLRTLADAQLKDIYENQSDLIREIGMIPSVLEEDIRSYYKLPVREFDINEKEYYQGEVAFYTNRGLNLPDALIQELEAGGPWGLAQIQSNIEGVVKYRNESRTNARKNINDRIQSTIIRNITTHKSLVGAENQSDSGKRKIELAKLASEQASDNAIVEVAGRLEQLLDLYSPENLSDSDIQEKIFTELMKGLDRPQYNDPEFYYFINEGKPGGTLGTPQNNIPLISVTKGKGDGTWSIDYQPLDNLSAWSRVARPILYGKKRQSRKILNDQFIFREEGIQELANALATGDFSVLSGSTRETLENFSHATGLPINEIGLQQVEKYIKGPGLFKQKLPEEMHKRLNANAQLLQSALPNYDASPKNLTPTSLTLSVTDWNPNNYSPDAVNKVVVRIGRPDGQLGNNPFKSPIPGTIIDSGDDKQLGKYVVIKADRHGFGYRKGDRILISGGSSIPQLSGKVYRGAPLIMTGGIGTVTGGLQPGTLQISIFKAGEGFPDRTDQYPQTAQNSFIRRNVYSLYTRTD